jgi:hypothetical protein
MKRIGWFDMMIYRIWYWRWNKILANRPDIREFFISYLKAFDVVDNGTPVKITVIIEPVDSDTRL